MRKIISVAAVLCAFAAPLPVMAAGVPDPVSGQKFAQIECGQCHIVEDRRDKAPPPRQPGAAPHFQTIAFDPEMTVDKIKDTLRLPHGEMANVLLAEKDIDNIISYIVSLRAR
jgi:mono/diheme cytochrome c family protein